jgi:hypothetical protein
VIGYFCAAPAPRSEGERGPFRSPRSCAHRGTRAADGGWNRAPGSHARKGARMMRPTCRSRSTKPRSDESRRGLGANAAAETVPRPGAPGVERRSRRRPSRCRTFRCSAQRESRSST